MTNWSYIKDIFNPHPRIIGFMVGRGQYFLAPMGVKTTINNRFLYKNVGMLLISMPSKKSGHCGLTNQEEASQSHGV